MDKSKLKEFLLSLEEKTIKDVEMNYEAYLAAGQVETFEVVELEQQSQQSEQLDLAEKLDEQLHEHTQHLAELNGIDFSPTDTIRKGAVVKVNDRYIFVGVPKSKFKFEDKTFIGISTEAPLYSCMAGKGAGDACRFNNTDFNIQEVY